MLKWFTERGHRICLNKTLIKVSVLQGAKENNSKGSGSTTYKTRKVKGKSSKIIYIYSKLTKMGIKTYKIL